MNIESNNQDFNLVEFLDLQAVTRKIVDEVSKKVQLGMNAKDIENIISGEMKKITLKKAGIPLKLELMEIRICLSEKKAMIQLNLTKAPFILLILVRLKMVTRVTLAEVMS